MSESREGEVYSRLLLNLPTLSGSFAPSSFLMSTAATQYEEEPSVYRQFSDAQRLWNESEDKRSLAFQFTVWFHEKRHFLDLVTTTFGHNLFMLNWIAVNGFVRLLSDLATRSEPLMIPVTQWVHNGAPESALEFVRLNSAFGSVFQHLSTGQVHHLPDTLPDEVVLWRDATQQPEQLYVKVKAGSGGMLCPLNACTLLEASAWHQQLRVMAKLDRDIAQWWEEFARRDIRHWIYTCCLRLIESIGVEYNDEIARIFDFAFMTPFNEWGHNLDEMKTKEADPAWRFYELIETLSRRRGMFVGEGAEDVCETNEWQKPLEVVEHALAFGPTGFEYPAIWADAASKQMSAVIRDFHSGSYRALHKRMAIGMESEDLLGLFGGIDDDVFFNLQTKLTPPVRVVVTSSGEMFFTNYSADSHLAAYEHNIIDDAWSSYMLLAIIKEQANSEKTIGCPMSDQKPAAHIPGNSRCTCALDRGECHIHAIFRECNVEVQTL